MGAMAVAMRLTELGGLVAEPGRRREPGWWAQGR